MKLKTVDLANPKMRTCRWSTLVDYYVSKTKEWRSMLRFPDADEVARGDSDGFLRQRTFQPGVGPADLDVVTRSNRTDPDIRPTAQFAQAPK